MKKIKVAVVGASGIVGEKIVKILENESYISDDISLFSSEKSAGKILKFRNKAVKLKRADCNSFENTELVFLATDEKISKILAPAAVQSGAIVIDNSSAFRLNPTVPLVVPEINLWQAKCTELIANPNCATAQCSLPLFALKQKFGLESVTVTTYQSVSGSGKNGLKEFFDKTADYSGENAKNSFFGCDVKSCCIPKIGEIFEDGYSGEERKIINETRKILGDEKLKISAFCVRVPAPYSHGAFVSAKLKSKFSLESALEALQNFPQITINKPSGNYVCDNCYCPVNPDATGKFGVFVGRVRININDPQTVEFFVVADNLLRGAAANAVLIARGLFEK